VDGDPARRPRLGGRGLGLGGGGGGRVGGAGGQAGQAGRGPRPDHAGPEQGGQGQDRDGAPLAAGAGEQRPEPGTPAIRRQDEGRRFGHDAPSG
jgi:hypothetical protein